MACPSPILASPWAGARYISPVNLSCRLKPVITRAHVSEETLMSFGGWELHPSFQGFFAEQNLKTPTGVQRQAVPRFLERKSIVVVSETGSGKTLAFVLPLMHLLKVEEEVHGGVKERSTPRAVILAPTRELAQQIYDVMKSVSHHVKLRVRLLTGGDSSAKTKSLGHSVYDILIATPARVKSALRFKELSLGHVKMLVLDEADNLFEMGFRKDIEGFLAEMDESLLQMGFFTATLPPAFDEFLGTRFPGKKLEHIHFGATHRPQPRIATYNVRVSPEEKDRVVRMFLEKEAKGRGVIFTNQRNQAEELHKYLVEKIPTLKMRILHGDLPASEREDAIRAFQSKKVQVLVATDVAARGIDVEDLAWVLNYGLPKSAIYYLHRCGRVGRGDRPGLVYNLVAPHDDKMVTAINEAIRGQTHLPLEMIPAEKVRRLSATKDVRDVKKTEPGKKVRAVTEVEGRRASQTVSRGPKAPRTARPDKPGRATRSPRSSRGKR